MKKIRHTSVALLGILLLCAASYAQDSSNSGISKKKTVDQACLEAVSDLGYLRSDHRLLEEKSAAQVKTIETQSQLIDTLRGIAAQQAEMVRGYRETIEAQKAAVASLQASVQGYTEELKKVRAERDKKKGGKLKSLIIGGAVGVILRLLL